MYVFIQYLHITTTKGHQCTSLIYLREELTQLNLFIKINAFFSFVKFIWLILF